VTTALELVRTTPFALVLIDPGLPGYDPRSKYDRLMVIRSVVEQSPTAIHIAVTGSDSKEEWDACRTIGVAGYIAKNSLKPGTMTNILEKIADHGFCVGLMHETSNAPEVYHSALSPREQEVLAWMRQRHAGVGRKVIYEQLGEHMPRSTRSAPIMISFQESQRNRLIAIHPYWQSNKDAWMKTNPTGSALPGNPTDRCQLMMVVPST
jgi:hypothetical protein